VNFPEYLPPQASTPVLVARRGKFVGETAKRDGVDVGLGCEGGDGRCTFAANSVAPGFGGVKRSGGLPIAVAETAEGGTDGRGIGAAHQLADQLSLAA
jgi:hypothetical protein